MTGTSQMTQGQVVARIGFAERWLARAKHQVAGGNLPRGVLTLVLADAEVHHALEVAGAAPPRRALRQALVSSVAVTLAALAIASAVAATRQAPAPAQWSAQAPPIVTLTSRVGALLDLVPAPASVSVVGSSAAPRVPVVAVPVSARRLVRQAPSAVIATRPQTTPGPVVGAPPPVSSTITTPVVVTPVNSAAPAPVAELSAGELIDLVLAAERALRSDPARH